MNTSEICERQEFIAEAWEKTRSEFFALAVRHENIIASAPPLRRTLTALLTENAHVLCREWDELLEHWLVACSDKDERISSQAKASLRQVKNQDTIDAICKRVWQFGDKHAEGVAIEASYFPSLPFDQSIFLFVTCQWDMFEIQESNVIHITNAYHADDPNGELRNRLRIVAISHSRRELVQAMTREYNAHAISALSNEERQAAVGILIAQKDWHYLRTFLANATRADCRNVCQYFLGSREKIPDELWTNILEAFAELPTKLRQAIVSSLLHFSQWDHLYDLMKDAPKSISPSSWNRITASSQDNPAGLVRLAVAAPIFFGIRGLQSLKELRNGLADFGDEEVTTDNERLLDNLMSLLPSTKLTANQSVLSYQSEQGQITDTCLCQLFQKQPTEVSQDELRQVLGRLDRYETPALRSLAECVLAFVVWAQALGLRVALKQRNAGGAYKRLQDEPERHTNEKPSQVHIS